YVRRGHAHAEQNEFRPASADYDRAAVLGIDSVDVWHARALLRLALNDAAGYRALTAEERRRHGADPATAERAAWTALLTPDGADDPAALLRLAETAV